jgi:hypothetical protein
MHANKIVCVLDLRTARAAENLLSFAKKFVSSQLPFARLCSRHGFFFVAKQKTSPDRK